MVSIPRPGLPDPRDVVRGGVRRAAASPGVRTVADRTGWADRVTARYVAGADAPAAVRTARSLLGAGRQVSIHDIRPPATSHEDALAARDAALALVDLLQRVGFAQDGRAEISLRLDALGQGLGSDGPALAVDLAREITAAAGTAGTTVTVDLEDPAATDATLAAVADLRVDHPWVGVVMVAGQRRTEADCRELNGLGSRVRLVKGAPGDDGAHRTQGEVDRAFARCLKVLVRGSGYPMVATGDRRLIEISQAMMTHEGRTTDSYEYQFQHGPRLADQDRLMAHGETVRIHLPYGPDAADWLLDRVAGRRPQGTHVARSDA